jgi:hypothetical protein
LILLSSNFGCGEPNYDELEFGSVGGLVVSN